MEGGGIWSTQKNIIWYLNVPLRQYLNLIFNTLVAPATKKESLKVCICTKDNIRLFWSAHTDMCLKGVYFQFSTTKHEHPVSVRVI